ncbi:1253_t:CDS:1, partial [Dentiscutata heterogama]
MRYELDPIGPRPREPCHFHSNLLQLSSEFLHSTETTFSPYYLLLGLSTTAFLKSQTY